MTFWEKYENLCEEKGLTPSGKEMVSVTGVSSAAITKWKKGAKPNFEIITKIARFFNVDIRYLVGISDSKHGEDIIERATDLLLNAVENIQIYDDDNGAGQEYIITYNGKSYNLQEHEYESICHELITLLNETELFTIKRFCKSQFK